MNSIVKWKIAIMMMALAFVCETANAQRWRRNYYPRNVVTVVTQPAVTVHVNNRFTQKERLAMAVAYLEKHKYLTVKKYAQMTRLTTATAEAELDAFVADKKKPIMLVVDGRKKLYTKK